MANNLLREIEYEKPRYLVNAIRRRFGNIEILGALKEDLEKFWEKVQVRAPNGFNNEEPQEVTRVIVDITAKEHINTGENEDEVEIYTNQEESLKESKSYSITFTKGWEFGGSFNIGASFFNALGAGSPSIGLGLAGKRYKKTEETTAFGQERALSQQYSLTGRIKVPPKTKLKVKITTYAVTYKTSVKVEFSAPSTARINFSYKPAWSVYCCAGNPCRLYGHITAEDLFENQFEYNLSGGIVTFSEETNLSYIGEVLQMNKEEVPLQ